MNEIQDSKVPLNSLDCISSARPPAGALGKGQVPLGTDGLVLGSMPLEGKGVSHDTDRPAYFAIKAHQIIPTASQGDPVAVCA